MVSPPVRLAGRCLRSCRARGHLDRAEHEAVDALRDHDKIRDGIRRASGVQVGSPDWLQAVGDVRKVNSEHLAEEEDEGFPDFRKHATWELRKNLEARWLPHNKPAQPSSHSSATDSPHSSRSLHSPAR